MNFNPLFSVEMQYVVVVQIRFYGEMCGEMPCYIAFRFYDSLDKQPLIAVNKHWRYIGTSLELFNIKILETYCIGRSSSFYHEYKHGERRVLICVFTVVRQLA